MTSHDESSTARTARTVGQLVKYSRELNQSRTVQEIGSYAVEATFHVMDGHPAPTITEVRNGDLRVLESMIPTLSEGGPPGELCQHAYEADGTVAVAADGTTVTAGDHVQVLEPADFDEGEPTPGTSIATTSVHQDEAGDVGVVIGVHWDDIDAVERHHVRPLEHLADHVATAIDNVRSRERLERAHQDLETRNQLLRLYDRILRHDLGNDLQVISGFSETIARRSEDDTVAEYADTIERTALNAGDLIGRVGDLVRSLDREEGPSARRLVPILAETVDDVAAKYDSLTVEFDPESVDAEVYAGELLDTVFANILSNAAVHNDDPVTVRVDVEEPVDDAVVIVFADDGSGIPPAVRENLFEMGQQGPDSDGTGYGLGFVRALTQGYGGEVAVTDSDRGGAEFRVTLERA